MEGYYIKKENILKGKETFNNEEMRLSSIGEAGFSSSVGTSRYFYHKMSYSQNINKVGINTTYNNVIARDYFGGVGFDGFYFQNNKLAPAAKIGERPIGLLLATLSYDGTGWYLYRKNGETWLSKELNGEDGIRLPHSPKVVTVELQGGGGGGAASGSFHASSGGAGGGYACVKIKLEDETETYSYFISVGNGGSGGKASASGNNGASGGDSGITTAPLNSGSDVCYARGGEGGKNDDGVAQGGTVYINNEDKRIINVAKTMNGGNGGVKENSGVNLDTIKFKPNIKFPENEKPWIRGGFVGGTSSGNNFGGGGGASLFANGGNADDRDNPKTGTLGSGGAGGGYRVGGRNGARGGDGFVNIYY